MEILERILAVIGTFGLAIYLIWGFMAWWTLRYLKENRAFLKAVGWPLQALGLLARYMEARISEEMEGETLRKR